VPFSEDLKMTSNTTDFDTFRVTIEELVINGAANDEIVASLATRVYKRLQGVSKDNKSDDTLGWSCTLFPYSDNDLLPG
jgi:hypothetical protein